MQLPTDLPPSFLFVGKDGAQFRVVYKLTATMGKIMNSANADKPLNGVIYKPLKNKRILVISSPPAKINFNVDIIKEHKLSSFFGKNGVSKIEVRLDRDAFQPTETVRAVVIIDNTQCEKEAK